MSEKTTDRLAKILVVEDNTNLNDILCKIMLSENYEPVPVLNGKDALDRIQAEGPFDLVLLDVMLPDPDMPPGMGIDGLEVCRRIKAHPELQDTLIFMVTVKDQPEDIMKGIDAGAYLV